jgi:hypothetical protein
VRDCFHDVAEKGRVRAGEFATAPGERCGAFLIKSPTGDYLNVIVGDGADWHRSGMPFPAWEHVSVSVRGVARCPTWQEMHWVKGLFWGEEECVLQFHPPQSDYVNCHPYTLHLWKPVGVDVPRPPKVAV